MKRRFIQPARNRLGLNSRFGLVSGCLVRSPDENSALVKQIRENKRLIENYILLLDRTINHEHYPSHYSEARRIRTEMMLLAEENNILRRRLWQEWLEADEQTVTVTQCLSSGQADDSHRLLSCHSRLPAGRQAISGDPGIDMDPRFHGDGANSDGHQR